MLLKNNILLAIYCGLLFTAFSVAALAIGPNDSPDPDSDTQTTRKSGDLWILYSGRSYGSRYRSNSMKLGSVGNRSFQGGGVHGGK